MRKFNQNIFKYFIIASVLVVVPVCAFAADKPSVGFVDIPMVMEKAQQVKDAENRLEDEFSDELDEISDVENTVANLEKKLRRSGRKMKESELNKLKKEVLSRKRDLKEQHNELRRAFDERRREELGKMQSLIKGIVGSIAKKRGIDLVISGPTLYVSDRINLTDDVLKALDKKSR